MLLASAHQEAASALPAAQTLFVGREAELHLLYTRLADAITGRGGLMLIAGEPGAGKSALIERCLNDLRVAAPNVRIIRTYCSEQYGADEPYQPFIEAFRQLVTKPEKPRGMSEIAKDLAPHWIQAIPLAGSVLAAAAATAAEVKQRKAAQGPQTSLSDVAKQLAPYWLEAIPLAGGMLAAAASTAVELESHRSSRQTRSTAANEESLFYQYSELFLAAADEAPLVLVVDDLHWSDRGSVALLAHLTRNVGNRAALIIGTYRPADIELTKHPLRTAQADLEQDGHAQTLHVTALDRAAIERYLELELGGDVAEEVTAWVAQHTSGNALFVTHLTKWLKERGYIEERLGEWIMHRAPAEMDIPRTAESVIEKRLLRLDPLSYKVLEYASAEGDRFHVTTVARVLGTSPPELLQVLANISQEHQLILPAGEEPLPDGETAAVFTFSHTIVQDVLHNNLLPRRRILLHRRIAEVLEQEYAAQRALIAHRLAIHYDEGRVSDRAYEFSLLSAEAAARVFAFGDAVDLFERALRNAQAVELRGHVFTRMGFCYKQMARLADASSAYQQALQMAGPGETSAIKRELIYVERDLGTRAPELLLREVQQLEQEARARNDVPELCRVLWIYRMLPAAVTWRAARVREALQLAGTTGSEELIAKGNFELGYTLMLDENPRAAIPHLQTALELHVRRGEPADVGLCYNCLAISHALLGDANAAVEAFGRAAAAFHEARTPANLASVRNNRAVLLIHRGDWENAEQDLRESLKLAERMGAGARVLHPLENMGRLCQEREDWPAARDHWETLLVRARQMGYWTAEVIALCGIGTADLELGRVLAARESLEQAQKILPPDGGWIESRVEWQLLAARIALAENDGARAVQLLDEIEAALSPRDRFRYAIVNYYRAEALLPVNAAAALEALRKCLDAFPEQSAHPKRLRAEQLLQRLELHV